jgi:hypothetical protein
MIASLLMLAAAKEEAKADPDWRHRTVTAHSLRVSRPAGCHSR